MWSPATPIEGGGDSDIEGPLARIRRFSNFEGEATIPTTTLDWGHQWSLEVMATLIPRGEEGGL
ncbi:hypothetical protein CRG98_004985 [Punica granatum]|uniref:Uncharacterized protein n=1 Tax=Punica granatum TaxID=22663 RepID=A0A2I0L1T9_PUNGR|nr:hypothetical protein CRG98_004985 [Punica granatum]